VNESKIETVFGNGSNNLVGILFGEAMEVAACSRVPSKGPSHLLPMREM
jgi:hypothetical protein